MAISVNWVLLGAASLIAPFAALFATSVLVITYAIAVGDATFADYGAVMPIAGFGSLFAYPLMAVLGLPAHSVLYRSRHRALPFYVLAGVLCALAAWILTSLFGISIRTVTEGAVFIALSGALTAGIFWLIRRPDRDAPNPPTSSP